MSIPRRLSALEARMAPGIDRERERFGRYIAMSEGISYAELTAEAERIMRAHPGESIDQVTAAIAQERGIPAADVAAEMESIMHAARAWAAGQT